MPEGCDGWMNSVLQRRDGLDLWPQHLYPACHVAICCRIAGHVKYPAKRSDEGLLSLDRDRRLFC